MPVTGKAPFQSNPGIQSGGENRDLGGSSYADRSGASGGVRCIGDSGALPRRADLARLLLAGHDQVYAAWAPFGSGKKTCQSEFLSALCRKRSIRCARPFRWTSSRGTISLPLGLDPEMPPPTCFSPEGHRHLTPISPMPTIGAVCLRERYRWRRSAAAVGERSDCIGRRIDIVH
jgi:hypothetical protein